MGPLLYILLGSLLASWLTTLVDASVPASSNQSGFLRRKCGKYCSLHLQFQEMIKVWLRNLIFK